MRKRKDRKQANQRIWFERWVQDGYSVKKLAHDLSSYETTKLWNIIDLWLEQAPPLLPRDDYINIKYVIFDGKYVDGRRLSLLTLVNAANHRPFASQVTNGETRKSALPFLVPLKQAGFSPLAVTLDGRSTIIKAFLEVWPEITIQRCHFHIELQVNSWCRVKPKTDSAKDLKKLVTQLNYVTSNSKARHWHHKYWRLVYKHQLALARLNTDHPVEGDIIRAYSLVKYALPNLFYYLEDSRIKRTTNACEGYFKKIQRGKGFDHPGLTKERLVKYLAWKIYFDNKNSN